MAYSVQGGQVAPGGRGQPAARPAQPLAGSTGGVAALALSLMSGVVSAVARSSASASLQPPRGLASASVVVLSSTGDKASSPPSSEASPSRPEITLPDGSRLPAGTELTKELLHAIAESYTDPIALL